MIQKKSKFLYHSCERVDHGELPMNKVCIDSRCSSNSLVCGDCIRADHLNHQVVSLGEFVERLQNVNYASKLFADNSSLMKQLKELKIQSAMILERTRNALLEQLQKLDVIAGHYNIVERSLEDVSEGSNFYFAYDASADLAEINKNIRRAVKQYNSNASGGEKLRAMVGQCREDNELMEGLLEGTVRQLKDVVEQLCGIYNKPPLAISSNVLSSQPAMLPKVCSPQSAILSKPRLEWSQTLKHTDIQVEGSRARRTKDTTDNYWAVCLADLGTTTSWCIHIVQSKSMDLALGIITGSQAKRISYCKGSAKGKEIGELVLLDSLGCGGSCLRDAVSGKKFPVKAGDVIQFDLDLSNLELHCSMNENKFVWSIDSLKPQDKYYACMFALVGDSVEIL